MMQPVAKASRRDASFWRYSHSQGSTKYHVIKDRLWSACGGIMLIPEDAIDAADVPEYQRCQKPGCRKRWPKESK